MAEDAKRPPRDARADRRQQVRSHILEVAQACFLRLGYAGASMSIIAGELGGSKGTLYGYFDSKMELLDAIMKVECGRLLAEIADVEHLEGDVGVRLERYAHDFLRILANPDIVAFHRLAIGELERLPQIAGGLQAAGLDATPANDGSLRKLDAHPLPGIPGRRQRGRAVRRYRDLRPVLPASLERRGHP